MKRIAVSLFLLSLFGCTGNDPSDAVATVPMADPDTITEPTFSFVAPSGFAWNEEHRIYYNGTMRTSISLAHAPSTDFKTVVADFTVERMLDAKLELLSKEIRDIDGRPTLLVEANRLNAPYPQKSLTAALATHSGCAQITAIYPATTTDEDESEIEDAIAMSQYVEPQ